MELAPDVAWIAGLMGEPARAAILGALVGGRALPAGELAFLGNVTPQTASFHLRKLMDAALITAERQGKHSYYRLASEQVAAALESLAALAPERQRGEFRARSRRDSERVRGLRFARSCYRHLAGALAVEIHRALIQRKILAVQPGSSYGITNSGREWWRALGVTLPATGRRQSPTGKACLDWTERYPHLGGPLGTALFSRLVELRWIVRNGDTRAMRVTHAGTAGLERELGIGVAAIAAGLNRQGASNQR